MRVLSGKAGPPAVPPAYAELMTTSNFSFLRGGSHPEELISAAVSLGLCGLGLCDRNSFAGVVRAHVAMRDLRDQPLFRDLVSSFRYLVGTRLVFADGTPDIVAYPIDRAAYGRLCEMLTIGNRRAKKGACILHFSDLAPFAEDQLFIFVSDETDWEKSRAALFALAALAPGRVYVGAAPRFSGTDRARFSRLAALAREAGTSLIAVNDVLYHTPERRALQDVLTCIREHLTLPEAGRRLEANAERHLKPPREMARLFREHRAAIDETAAFMERIRFSLDDLRYSYPEETVGNGESADQTLERLAFEGAQERYPAGIPEEVRKGVWSELCLIAYKRYAPYFLTVHDLVRFARHERGILCQGRGSAANSMVCFCLGVTEVEPAGGNLLFGRFISTERNEPPDIDVDFEHERREEVMQYLYEKYGRLRAGLTATVVCFRSRGALREVAKVFGLSGDAIAALNGLSWGWSARTPEPDRIREAGLDPTEPVLAKVLALARAIMGFPRHLSQHVGGFVLTRDRLDHYIPIANAAMDGRTTVEWDKDDLDATGLLKVDVLALGMLSCIRRAFELLRQNYGRDVSRVDLMREHETQKARVFAMTHRADTIGVFQIESRAQMSMLPRLRPVEFYDLVIEVAIVRPGPIQGGMVHPYLQRRLNREKVEYPSEALKAVLERTLGVPLFQEQAMQIAIVAAGFTAGEADQLRRAMATWRRNGRIEDFRARFLAGMDRNGYPPEFAKACFSQIEGFGEYGFPESHAASFALLVYVSCWLKCHYPDVFACALLNSQPMGFYAPAQIIRDAIEHGVEMRDVDVNLSDYDGVLEPDSRPAGDHLWPRHKDMAEDIWSDHAVRLGLRHVKGLKQADAMLILARRGRGYDSVRDLWLRTGLSPATLETLARADAFRSLGLDRRDALWAVRGLLGTEGAETLPLFQKAGLPAGPDETDALLPPMPLGESVVHDYRTLSFSLKAHPLSFLRKKLDERNILPASELVRSQANRRVETAGLVLVRQRPGTASGVIFATLEDETGIANIIVWPKVFEANRRVLLGARLLSVRGMLQREGLVVHIIAESMTDMTPWLLRLAEGHDFGDAVVARADEGRTSPPGGRDMLEHRRKEKAERQARAAWPQGRNFH